MKLKSGTDHVFRLILALVAVALLIAAPFALKPYGIYLLSLWAVMTIAGIGLNLTLGYAGQISLATWWMVRSPWGRAFTALRENPIRAASLGVDTRRYTLMAFAIGSALGGIAGVLYAPLVQFIEPTAFALGLSFNLLLMVIVGGAGRFFGPFLGAAVSVLLPEWLRFSEGLYLMLYALFVMILLAFCPSGLLGLAERLRKPWRPSSKSAT